MKALALLAIRLYQRFLSPHKGFTCAYRAYTGRAGCSGLGYRAIRRYGTWRGWLVLRRRLEKCGEARRRLLARHALKSAQAGFCDGLDVCSGADACSGSEACSGANLLPNADTACNIAGCACDLGDLFSRREDEQYTRENWALYKIFAKILGILLAVIIIYVIVQKW